MTLTVTLRDLTIGTGQPVKILRATHLWAAPDLRANTLGRPQRHGMVGGRDLRGGRRVTVVAQVQETGMSAALTTMRQIQAAWRESQTDLTLAYTDPSGSFVMFGRPQLAEPDLTHAAAGIINLSCRFLATDPLTYSATEDTGSTTFPEQTDIYVDGYEHPNGDLYADPLTDGRIVLANDGTVDTPWRAEIVGPWTNPKIQLIDPSLPFPPPVGITELAVDLADGEVLAIDSRTERITVDGLPRLDLHTLDLDWFGVPPGEWALRFTGDAGSGSAEAWIRSAWQ